MGIVMKRKKIHYHCSIALAVIMFVIGSLQGFVLCYAEDGQVAVEFASNRCCDNVNKTSPSKNSTASLNAVFLSSMDNCGPCVDTLISVEAIQAFKKTNPANSTNAVSVAMITSAIRSYDFFEYQLDSELFSSVNPCLSSLRTIVLLV